MNRQTKKIVRELYEPLRELGSIIGGAFVLMGTIYVWNLVFYLI